MIAARHLCFLSFFFSTGSLWAATSSLPLGRLHVVLDAGHGGRDTGAKFGEFTESAVTLSVTKKLHRLLQDDPNFMVTLTRPDDRFVSLPERTAIATAAKADIFLSLHVNSSPSRQARGAEFYFQNQLPPTEESLYLASLERHGENAVQQEASFHDNLDFLSVKPEVAAILQDLRRQRRLYVSSQLARHLVENWTQRHRSRRSVIRQAPFHVVSATHLPATLVELGYASHEEERTLLNQPAEQERIAMALKRGLTAFKEFIDKNPEN